MWLTRSINGRAHLTPPERLNGYFMPGLLVALTNTAVIAIFYQGSVTTTVDQIGLSELILYSLLNGILAAAVALGGMYIVTLLFNLPTGLKLVELSQPSQPLLPAAFYGKHPGTYQHSLYVANLAEQGANAIGVNADLVRVAALYHDIGKVINAPFLLKISRRALIHMMFSMTPPEARILSSVMSATAIKSPVSIACRRAFVILF